MITYRTALDTEWPAIIDLCTLTIKHINSQDYLPEQVREWVSRISNPGRMKNRLIEQSVWVAVDRDSLAGVITWKSIGYIDLLYVSRDHQRQGIGSRLLAIAEEVLSEINVREIQVDVSLTAKPLFEQNGYEVLQMQQVVIGAATLTNFKMVKRLNVPEEQKQ
ncbi:MAG: GNAT family N-acetyltransferase [Saprospiraceae bacterium]|nr:GNAT family N-acetyltransferase [Saprospiraceae bacterium]MCB9319537.1 GNAT family N-acetyltransferase [Lewinellaceae bacterium]